IGIKAKVIENQRADDEEVSEEGIPRVIVLGYDGLPIQPVAPPSPDYIPGPEDPQIPPVPQDEDERELMFIQAQDPDYVPEPIYPKYIPLEDLLHLAESTTHDNASHNVSTETDLMRRMTLHAVHAIHAKDAPMRAYDDANRYSSSHDLAPFHNTFNEPTTPRVSQHPTPELLRHSLTLSGSPFADDQSSRSFIALPSYQSYTPRATTLHTLDLHNTTIAHTYPEARIYISETLPDLTLSRQDVYLMYPTKELPDTRSRMQDHSSCH
ncbi:hypothetical protein Tco_1378799, partial [Tanacetum coccineum]